MNARLLGTPYSVTGMSGQSVIIVDDDVTTSIALKLQLGERGFQVLGTARSPADAERLVRTEKPDLVLTDILFGTNREESGISLARKIRGFFAGRIVFMSGLSDDDTLAECRSIPNSDLIRKPFGVADLVSRLSVARSVG